MEYRNQLEEYTAGINPREIAATVEKALARSAGTQPAEVYRTCFACLDLTSLNAADSAERITELALKTIAFGERFPGIPNVAAICVYPPFVETVGLAIGDARMKIASVAGGFPSAQTFLEVKMLEVAMAVENGADEIDFVMNTGEFLAGNWDEVANEIEIIRQEMGEDVTLKVIIESGELGTAENIRAAAILSMLAGADFVKTSTGRASVGATPEAAAVICEAIKEHRDRTGRMVGFKAAGGVNTAADAALYHAIADLVLGAEWLNPRLFRIGASSAANSLLGAVEGRTVNYF